MLYQYYFKKIKMFKLPYKVLLAYHSPAGNSIKVWTYYQMLPHIIAIRKEIHILSLTFTVIQILRVLIIIVILYYLDIEIISNFDFSLLGFFTFSNKIFLTNKLTYKIIKKRLVQ